LWNGRAEIDVREMVYKPSENYIERHLSLASLLRIYKIAGGRIIVIGDLAVRRHNSAAAEGTRSSIKVALHL
jgi:hypothetical protein